MVWAEVETCFEVGVFGLASVRACDSCLVVVPCSQFNHFHSIATLALWLGPPFMHCRLAWCGTPQKTPQRPNTCVSRLHNIAGCSWCLRMNEHMP